MALEHRDGRVYYYTSRRVGRRVVRRYGGAGRIAVLSAQLDAADRQIRHLDRQDVRFRADIRANKLAALRKWLARLDRVVSGALESAGWHRHHRGEWRRKRGVNMTPMATATNLPWHGPELANAAGELDPATADKAAAGDRSVVAAVDEFLTRPAAVALWGDMGRRVLLRWVGRYAGKCLTTERALLRFAADLRDRLAGADADALVQLVAERVVVAWVTLAYFENQYAAFADGLTVPHHKFHMARIELAHRNLMAACRTLAKVRRAKLPDVVALVSVRPPATGLAGGE